MSGKKYKTTPRSELIEEIGRALWQAEFPKGKVPTWKEISVADGYKRMAEAVLKCPTIAAALSKAEPTR